MAEIQLEKRLRSRIEPGWPLVRKIKVWLYQTLIPLIAYPLIRALTLSYRWRVQAPQELLDLLGSGRPFAVATWHGDMLLMQSLGRHLGLSRKVVIPVALSQAGEVEARVLRRLGYRVVRGSQKRRGSEALEEMIELIGRGAIAAFAVDGPSGPPGTVKPGVIRLAQRCQIPVVPFTFARQKEWQLPTWDSTRIPRPFSHCIALSTIPIAIPAELDGDQFEAHSRRIAETLEDLKRRPVTWEQAIPTHRIPRPLP